MPRIFAGRCILLGALALAVIVAPASGQDSPAVGKDTVPDVIVEVSVDPVALSLSGPDASWSLLVNGTTSDGRIVDLTRTAIFKPSDSNRIAVSSTGRVQGIADGDAFLTVDVAGRTKSVTVGVTGSATARKFPAVRRVQ